MANVKLDKVTFSSFHESFRNREQKETSITLSGTIPAFSASVFTSDIPLVRNQAVFDVYHQRQGSYPKRLASNSRILTDVTWSGGDVYLFVNNVSANLLRVEIYVANSGSAAAITTQTIDVDVYVYDTPFSA